MYSVIVHFGKVQFTFSTRCAVLQSWIPPSVSSCSTCSTQYSHIFLKRFPLGHHPLLLLLKPVSCPQVPSFTPCLSTLLSWWKRNEEGENSSDLRPHCLHINPELNLHPDCAPSPPCVCVCVCAPSIFPIDLILRGVSALSKSIHVHLSSASRVGWALNHLNPTLRETRLVPCSDTLTNDIGQDAVAGDPRRGMGPISGQVHHHPGSP